MELLTVAEFPLMFCKRAIRTATRDFNLAVETDAAHATPSDASGSSDKRQY